jgi:PAS domain S-box-containing protein
MNNASVKYPIFPHFEQGRPAAFMFDPGKIKEIDIAQLVEGYQTFLHELYQTMMKLTRTRANGAKEARSIAKAFQEMLSELADEHEKAVAATQQEREREGEGTTIFSPLHPSIRPSLPNPECTLDASRVITYANDDLAQMLGYNKVDLIGRPFITLLNELSRTRFDETFNLLGEKGISQPDVQLSASNGSIIPATLRLTALYDTQGNFVMTRCNVHVVSDTERIKQKDREIEQLREAMHRAGEELASVASSISHDLRQPLHAILVLCQFLQEEYAGRLEERGREYLASIEKAASRMKQMVEDVVHYARITSSSNAYEPVDLNQLLDEVREGLAPQLSERRATLLQKGELPVVTCDRERFKELFAHLISNGIKFNNKEQPTVEVSLVKQDTDGYTFFVQDNGIGIEEPYHETIFRLFQRLHKPEEYSGSGAGLAICRRIVESHGGRIWVRAQPNEGSTFFFTLPMVGQW